MDEETRELDLQVGELMREIKRLGKIEQAALAVVKSFSNSIDYCTACILDNLSPTLWHNINILSY